MRKKAVKGNRRYTDPHGKRRHPYQYAPEIIHEMLLDDYKRSRPFWGPGIDGAEGTVFACEKVAAHRRITVEEYFTGLMAEGAALTGRTTVPLA